MKTPFQQQKIYIPTLFTFLLFSFWTCTSSSPSSTIGWKKVYQNDADGKALFGNKDDLISAVRNGYSIRIGWGGRRVEHVADADFLTIGMGKEVFAQIKPIMGQRPDFSTDTLKLDFRVNNKWVKIAGTNGRNSALMFDYQTDTIVNHNNTRTGSTTWYVNYNSSTMEETGTPLWHPSSPFWEDWNEEE